ncbi:tyrosine-type recombinase/integrase [Serratia proteamaculans]|uniref:phage integrase n=1 Tax=Serratia proteamaculans TaxID=28151 RepID=UPI0010216E93|nr:tyrosine-type recombinase/integrase [Serratia proteamaculans]RYM50729.1 integrase [Serratia proteamaculans]
MTVKLLEGGRYKVDIRPRGTAGRRVQRIFDKKADAVAFERYVLSNMHNKEWLDKPADHRRLSELLTRWWELEGRSHKYGGKRLVELEKLIGDMDDPRASQLARGFITEYRSQRLYEGIKASTINRELTTLRSMFRVLIEAEDYHPENPLKGITVLKEEKPEMSYLTEEEIARLLSLLDGDARRLAILCLSTGGRWGETLSMLAQNVMHGKVTFTKTKNGRARTVPISDEVMQYVKTRKTGRLFDVSYPDFREVLKAMKPDLPKGQATHVLRHTFAAHFMINGGNILTLNKILGHSTIEQTMAYAHFSPDHLNDAVTLNPLRTGIHIPSTNMVNVG